MTSASIPRPSSSEYAPFYEGYISKVPAGDLLALLEDQRRETQRLLATISEPLALKRYAPGKWSVKEVVGHLIDSERIFAYRALRFARGDETPLPGFDEKRYAPAGEFDRRALADLAAEFDLVRRASLALLGSFEAKALARRGTANGQEITVRAIAYIIAGHERHHVQILRERYLV
jgi:uncharacterized damage-inducible protein DinB